MINSADRYSADITDLKIFQDQQSKQKSKYIGRRENTSIRTEDVENKICSLKDQHTVCKVQATPFQMSDNSLVTLDIYLIFMFQLRASTCCYSLHSCVSGFYLYSYRFCQVQGLSSYQDLLGNIFYKSIVWTQYKYGLGLNFGQNEISISRGIPFDGN